ncbi:MAG TPA: serine/threonine-protein kinase [Terriglobales bacterium]|nr:serine/threonine-protein kinase [Terriglobales bacterium]
MSEESTKRVGDYEVLAVLGSGGMGRVYKVRNVISDRVEAMKILLPDLAGKKDLAERFLREIKVLAALNHPNIAALRTALTLNNQLVMVMEYVEGNTLAARLEHGPMSPQDALNYIDQVLDALSYAHQQNVIHRDIKPANMMLTPQGVVKLMDFGIARSGTDRGLTSTGTTLGSLYYMSPEQVKGAPTDARSDLYSVGVSLYEMVTGRHPFQADSDFSILAAHLQEPPTPPRELRPDLPEGLNEIILLALAKDPGQRFQSAAAFRAALRSVEVGRAASASAAPVATPTQIMPTPVTSVLDRSASAEFSTPPLSDQFPMQSDLAAQPQTQAAPSVLEMSARSGGSRGLYMALGALVVLAGLVIAGLYLPGKLRTNAGGKKDSGSSSASSGSTTTSPDSSSANNGGTGATTSTSTATGDTTHPADNSGNSYGDNSTTTNSGLPGSGSAGGNAADTASSSTMQSAESGTTAGESSHTQRIKKPVQAGSRQKLAVSDSAQSQSTGASQSGMAGGSQTQGSANSLSQGADAKQLEDLEQDIIHLASRAGSVNDSLERMRQQQAAQGVGLNNDVSSAQQRMAMYMARAQTALQNQDARAAKKYLDLAEPEVVRLEKFLGR